MISSSGNSVNNWWESDGSMKGIYQQKISCNYNRNSKKIFATNRGPNGNAQTTLNYDCIWFPRDTHCKDIMGSDGNHISDLLSPSALFLTTCFDEEEASVRL